VLVAGKTGTAEIGLKDRWHSWFAAFGPYDAKPEEQVVVVTMVEASNPWEWWAPYASNLIFQSIFAGQDAEAAAKTLGLSLEGQHLRGGWNEAFSVTQIHFGPRLFHPNTGPPAHRLRIASIYSAGIDSEGVRFSNEYSKQIIWAVSGLGIMIAAMALDISRLKDYTVFAYMAILSSCFYIRDSPAGW
jgi:hypothetical protein